MDSTTLKIASTLSILVPIILNGARLKRAGILGRLFFVFLLSGLITDLGLWYVQATHVKGISLNLFNAYSLVEAMFFFWLIRHIAPNRSLKKIAGYFLYGTPIAWIVPLVLPGVSGLTSQHIPFVTSYEVAAAFLAGFALLSMAERGNQLTQAWDFWLMLGVFFYCFCTFFVMTLIGSQLSLNLWPLNNVINILTYLFYSVGWWRYPADMKPNPRPAP